MLHIPFLVKNWECMNLVNGIETTLEMLLKKGGSREDRKERWKAFKSKFTLMKSTEDIGFLRLGTTKVLEGDNF